MPRYFSEDSEAMEALYHIVETARTEVRRCVELDAFDELIDEEGDEPWICLTVGFNPGDGSWNYQTGDNSYTGGAYSYPYWGVGWVGADSDPAKVAKEIAADCDEQIAASLA